MAVVGSVRLNAQTNSLSNVNSVNFENFIVRNQSGDVNRPGLTANGNRLLGIAENQLRSELANFVV